MPDDQIQREIEYVPISTENLGRFSEMFELCFSTRVGPRYFQWKYAENPLGNIVGFEARHQGKPIASYGLIPEHYEIEGQPLRVYQSMDTMTHPSYQRRGLFVKLANLTFEHVLKTEGTLDMVGVPGANSFPGFINKLGWKSIHEFATVFAHREMFRVAKTLARPPKLTMSVVRELTPELSDFLSQRQRSPRPIRNALSPGFFNWRVFLTPTKRFEVVQLHEGKSLVGVLVFTLNARLRAMIHLIEFAHPELIPTHTAAAVEYLFTQTPTVVAMTWKPLDEALNRAYARSGFVSNPFKRGPMTYRQPLIVRSETGRVGGVDWYDIRNYDVQPLMQD